ncbi:DUF72 domain-containing protein [Noviherbaspirillum saxi]|uniref:DUF72 domain-containing protein n=1 Tax=Noviherbaspirillum saxi TaxID=2320863 RepID=A0A3A3FTV6_9BURK|nr:DUF72 domain-containing protein [Noviherbaspirillum saxi]RJF97611.1 DUF72 domain-containing protein [Noviherbaspirillum saxi]
MQNNSSSSLFIGCAGWSVPSAAGAHFPADGSHLQRYAQVLNAVEINTSFYRPHRPVIYVRWRDSVPETFRFSAKVPKHITHELRLKEFREPLKRFIGEVRHLGNKLDCLLVQLPPRLSYNAGNARSFFVALREMVEVDVVCEPRHASWFTSAAADMLHEQDVSYVIADPRVTPVAIDSIAGHMPTIYLRLHGSPEMYYSSYSDASLEALAARIKTYLQEGSKVWCVFDNTANGAAVPNALFLLQALARTAGAGEPHAEVEDSTAAGALYNGHRAIGLGYHLR